ncbi:MAG: hypothetical protein O2890_04945 [Cyanobacteria bacterium]|nr:hypothetical protein [Cyanobacteriota bacterium]MDA0865755.1 hypothetical protein [Cyanobacteriota bacterium]
MKKVRQGLLLGLAGVLAVLTVGWLVPRLLAWGVTRFYFDDPPVVLLESRPAPHSDRAIEVTSQAPWAYGSHGLTLTIYQGDRVLTRYQTTLRNDGANLSVHNVQIRWVDATHADVCLRGQEQDPAGLQVTLEEEIAITVSNEACDMESQVKVP